VPSTEDDPHRREILGGLRTMIGDGGMDPEEVADHVVRAIRERCFFVLTHPSDALAAVDARRRWMESGVR
jgi:hypothetical protein